MEKNGGKLEKGSGSHVLPSPTLERNLYMPAEKSVPVNSQVNVHSSVLFNNPIYLGPNLPGSYYASLSTPVEYVGVNG